MSDLVANYSGVTEAGCDEAGRGCLAGPVFAAAVVLPSDFYHPLLNDSKKISQKVRMSLINEIKDKSLGWCVAMVDHTEIDEINILNASILAMHRALEGLQTEFKHIVVDGNRFKAFKNIPHTTIVKGDGKVFSIAAASVLAKEARDEFMRELDVKYPQYGWKKNMGYPTKVHRAAIAEHGISDYHRKSFKLTDSQLKINF